MQSKHASQLDHTSAFIRRSTELLNDHLKAIDEELHEIKVISAATDDSVHEYARIAFETFQAVATGEPIQEIDWTDVDRVELLASAGRFIKAIKP
ncbi:hypothetical protein D9M70_627640 [compost metagenome]